MMEDLAQPQLYIDKVFLHVSFVIQFHKYGISRLIIRKLILVHIYHDALVVALNI